MEENSIAENPIVENVSPIGENSQPQEKYLPLKNFVHQRPYWGAILLFLYALLILEGLRGIILLIGLAHYKIPYAPGNLVAEGVLAFLWVFIPISLLNWWRTPAFRALLVWPSHIRRYRALLLGLFLLMGLVPVLLLAFSKPIHQTALPIIVMITILCLFIGIAEEGLFRGLILTILLPKGIWKAVLLSSLLFGCMHILNVFVGYPLNAALIQMFAGLGFGLFLAAVRLRTSSLWPGIIAHGLWDLPSILLNIHRQHISSPSLLLTFLGGSVILAICLGCTLIVLRPEKLRELRDMYSNEPTNLSSSAT